MPAVLGVSRISIDSASLSAILFLLTATAIIDFFIFHLTVPWACEHFRLKCRCGCDVRNQLSEVESLPARIESNALQRVAHEHMNSLDAIDVVVGVITMERLPLLRYLTETATTLIRQLFAYKGPKRFVVLFCNVDASPQNFTEFQILTNQTPFSLFPVVVKHPIGLQDRRRPALSSDAKFETEKDDYAFCLSSALAHFPRARHVLYLEDDAVPLEGFFQRTSKLIDTLHERAERNDLFVNIEVPFVKLYHPEWFRKFPWLPQVALYAVTLGVASGWLCKWIRVARLLGLRMCASGLFPLLFGVVQTVFYFTTFCCLGHDFLAQLRDYVSGGGIYLLPSESCCSPAILFDSWYVQQLSDFLYAQRVNANFHKDHMLDEFGGGGARMVDINFVRHIGEFSSLRGKIRLQD